MPLGEYRAVYQCLMTVSQYELAATHLATNGVFRQSQKTDTALYYV